MHLQELAPEILKYVLVKQLSHLVIVLSTKQRMLDSFCPISKCLTTHLSYHRFLHVNEAPRAAS